ncbi:MAG TPA: hypothetical protein ENH39_08205 [Gammaproteobacteria bacterium]|nr:hypothetical protein [Gammaproteobacteria bacterium]
MAVDGQRETTQEHQSLQGMAEGSSALSIADVDPGDDSQGTGALQLLSCHREHDLAVDILILQGGGQVALQVVESTEPKAKPDVGGNQAGIEGIRLSSTQPNSQGGMNRGHA